MTQFAKKMNQTTRNIKNAGMTLAGWAMINKFNAGTVRHVVIGDKTGGPVVKRIIAALKRDKFWVRPRRNKA